MHRRIAALAIAALALTGCIVQPPPIVPTATEAWRVDARLLSYPLVVGDVAIAYASDGDDDLTLGAWRADGSQAWRLPAAPLADGMLVELMPLAGDSVVPFLAPVAEGVAWMAVDVATGTPAPWTAQRPAGGATTWASVYHAWRCAPGADPGGVCFSVPDGTDTTAEFLRMRPDAGIDAFPFPVLDVQVFATDRGVYTNRADGTVELLVDGSRLWSRPWADLFDVPIVDGGLLVAELDDALVLTTYEAWDTGSDDVSLYATAAVDARSGAVLWRQPGAFPCAGGDALVLCSGTGTATPTVAAWTSVTVQGIDARTGAETWRLDVAEAGLEVENAVDGWTWYGDWVVSPDEQAAPTMIDVASGERVLVPEGAALPCASGAGQTLPWGDVAIPVAEAVAWCEAPGAPAADPMLHASVVTAVGLPLGDVLLVPEPGAIVAYRV